MQVFTPMLFKRKNLVIRSVALLLPVICLVALLTPVVFAKTTYVITDGAEVHIYESYATNPEDVLSKVGVELNPDDTYTTQPGNGVSEITVQRSQNVVIHNCGETVEAVAFGETLEQLLTRLGISVQAQHTVSMPLDTLTYDGMEVRIDYILSTEEIYTVDIPFETTYCYDPNLPEGQEKVLVAGVTGQMRVAANVVYTNAQESNRSVIEETVIQQPVNQIIAIGTNTGNQNTPDVPAIGDGIIVTTTGEILTYTKAMKFKATAYTKTDAGCDDYTALGTLARVGAIAVDPKVIPYGTRMFIVSDDGQYIYGIATAEDCGGGVQGNHVDLYFDTTAECFKFGVRSVTIYFLG